MGQIKQWVYTTWRSLRRKLSPEDAGTQQGGELQE